MSWTAAQIAEACGGALSGDAAQRVDSVSIDTRTIEPGALFVAITGEQYDGHDFVANALERGAAAVLVEHAGMSTDVTTIRVHDTLQALGAFASAHRASFDGPVVAITGSNGKTTTKELCADVLAAAGLRVRRTPGNLNNHIGLPLSILGLRDDDQTLVVELGMNHAGEIDHLARIARPDVGAITMVAPAHIGLMGSLEKIAQAKGELLDRLPEDGVAVLNGDDAHVMSQRERFTGRTLLFGFDADRDFSATELREQPEGTRFRLGTPEGSCEVTLALPGVHLVQDALCAAGAAYGTGQLGSEPLEPMRRALEAFRGVRGRTSLQVTKDGVRVLDESYNANPSSVEAALDALAQIRGDGRAVAVLGDMGELGDRAAEMHADVGRAAAARRVDYLLCVGPLSRHTAQAARDAGVAHTEHVDDVESAVQVLQEWLRADDALLVKGSHAMGMERITLALGGQG